MAFITQAWPSQGVTPKIDGPYLEQMVANVEDLAARLFVVGTPSSGDADGVGDGYVDLAGWEKGGYAFPHKHRYLWFITINDGPPPDLIPFSGTAQAVSLSDNFDAGGGYIDLEETVDWLAPGMLYVVRGVSYAFETPYV